jgi:ATP-dependent RNA helicase RhlE
LAVQPPLVCFALGLNSASARVLSVSVIHDRLLGRPNRSHKNKKDNFLTDSINSTSEQNVSEQSNTEDLTIDAPFSLDVVSNKDAPEEGTFSALGLIKPLQKALAADGYIRPTPIQLQAIPALLEGHDLIGCAQTGTGKTAAFALPLLQHLFRNPKAPGTKCARVLVLSPTRELASQIHTSFGSYGRFLNIRRTAIYGGVNSFQQIKAMARGVDVLVATPGRLLDLINQRRVSLEEVEALVLDEADRMLDMGFINDIRKIAAMCPADRQTLMFSATMDPTIAKLAKALLHMPKRVDVAPQATTAENVEQHVLCMERPEKLPYVLDMLQNGGRFGGVYKALIFTRTKHGANRLDAQLHKAGIKVTAIHGNKSQNQRKKALDTFRKGHLQVMVATDVAARGLDIDDITHVINYDIPTEPDSYVHRIGRTGRAGASGIAISLCDNSERGLLRDIERTIGNSLTGDALTPTQRGSSKKGPGKKKSKFKGKGPRDEGSKSEGFKKKKSFKRTDTAKGKSLESQGRDQSHGKSQGENRQKRNPGKFESKNGARPDDKQGQKPKRRRQNKRKPDGNGKGGQQRQQRYAA